MDRQAHDYTAAAAAAAAAAVAYAQQQQQKQFGFHPQHQQQYPPPAAAAFMGGPSHPSIQQYPYPPPQLHPHAPPPHPHPHLLHKQQQQQQQQQPPPSHPYPPRAALPPQYLPSPFHGPYDSSPPPPAPPPSDPELQKRIDKLAEYVIKNGPEFEVMVREKEQDNSDYGFLFGGEGHNYYRYKLWLSSRPFNAPFPPSSMPVMHPPPNAMMNPGSMAGGPPMHQPPFPPFYDQQQLHQHPQQATFGRPEAFKGPLPPDVAMELNNMFNTLNGTKDSIKSAKIWFMQRSLFAPALAEALRERVFALDDSERQLHIIYLTNDILFDSLQRRINPHDLDNEAIAFKPVLGSMLARVYHNPQNKDENQSRLQKIIQFWASKEVYDQDTIKALEGEMFGGPPNSFSGSSKDFSAASADSMAGAGFPQQATNHNTSRWQPDRQSLSEQEHPDKQMPPVMPPSLGTQQVIPNSVASSGFPGSMPISSPLQPANQQPPHLVQVPANTGEKLPPYPLFPPGLIPGMVRKMQIGSGVPYSPLSPLDIPTMIPPSDVSQSEILERVSKFFKEIGEVNPSEGPMKSPSKDDDYEYERESPVRKGGACIPPPPNLQVDPETGAYPDGSVERKPGPGGSGRLGLGATADPNEPSQYDDVYTSYRKQRSTTYHSSMSTRAATR